MAEQERLTNKERRAQAREERRRKAEQEAREARRRRTVTLLSSALVVALIATVVVTAFAGSDDTIEDEIVLSPAAVEEARAAAGCEVVAEQPLPPPYTHFDAASAPPADQLYTGPRPTNSGPHFSQQHPLVRHGSDNQIDERATTHNLEHGSIIAWYDPEQVESATVDSLEDWSERLNDSGFTEPRAGTGIFVSPYTDPGISSGKAIALRAWGYSLDCDTWDEDVANAFVLERYGDHGIAPEGSFAPFPEGTIRYEDQDGAGATEEPTTDATDDPTADPTADPSVDATAEPTDDPTPAPTATE